METKQEYWEGLAAGSFFLVATGAMMFIVLAVLDLIGTQISTQINGWASLVAVAGAAIGGLLLMIEAGNKAKAYLIVANPASMASKNAIMMTLFMGIAFVYATFFFDFIPWAGLEIIQNTVAVLGIITALIAVVIPALELGESRGRAFWDASALGPVFIITSAASGLAAVILTAVIMGYAENISILILDKVLLGFLVLQLISVVTYVFGKRHSGAYEARKAADNILNGQFKISFWGGIILAGTIVPILMLLLGSISFILIAKTVLVLIGGACFRNVFLQAAIRKPLPGEENEFLGHEEILWLAEKLEKRWQEKAAEIAGR
ncbi:MAG TPA: NrfD/PsrC family molybdoenzyme membrane anchor subunit [Syntrophomonadaceae bacterium]|nr:NrfD/PsrC family molybdoenzyme membrane anchor subunit [Syntrophomonadaceae bacterium]